MDKGILAIDCGTSRVKALLISENGDFIQMGKLAVSTDSPSSIDAREWDPLSLVGDLAECIYDANIKASRRDMQIVGISLTTTTSSLVVMKESSPMSGIPPLRWDDVQSLQEAIVIDKLRQHSQDFPWLEKITPDSGISKALFLIRRFPYILSMPDVSVMEQWTYLNWWLTGKTVQSETIMSRKWGLTKEYPWRDGYTKKLGQKIKEYLGDHPVEHDSITWFNNKMLQGEIVTAGDKIGNLSRRIHNILDITTPVEVGVYSAPFDTCAQMMGLGLVKSDDTVGLSFGTSLGVGVILDKNEHTTWCCFGPVPFLPIHDTAMLFDGVASCGGAVSYICSQYGLWKDGHPDYNFIEEALSTTEPGAEGVTILPYFQGGRRTTANFPAVGTIDGLRININEKHVIRALLESLTYIIRSIIENFEKYLSRPLRKLRAGGGPTANAAFMKMIATVTNRPIEVSPFADTALLGTAICAMYGLGWEQSLEKAADRIIPKFRIIHPDNEQVKTYERLYKSYLKRYHKIM